MDLRGQIEMVTEALRFVADRTLAELKELPEVLFDEDRAELYWISGPFVWTAGLNEDAIDIESARPAGLHDDPFQAGWEQQIAGMLWLGNGNAVRALACEGAARWIFITAGRVPAV